MEEMSWPEIKEAIESGKTTVILPVASIEQHGPHLPTATDTLLGTKLSELTAKKLGTALVAAAIRPGLSGHHTGFPGTLTISPRLFLSLLEEYCENLKRCGFKNIVLFSSHGGNTDTMMAYLPYLARELSPDVGVWLLNMPTGVRTAAQEANEKVFAREGISIPKAGVHAGWAETSQLMVFYPELVNMDRAERGQDDPVLYEQKNIRKFQNTSFIHGIHSQSPNGVLGDSRGANAEVGRELNEIFATYAAEEIKNLLS